MRNIIITGGELFNKGAQAMTFIAVDQLKRRFPEHKIYVLSEMDCARPKEEKALYAFEFMGWNPIKFARSQSNPLLRLICILRNKRELYEAENIYRNTDLMIDVSGYALGSNWDFNYCNRYLDHLEFAKAFKIPVYLMPQSFGPFDFAGEEGRILDKRIRELLPETRIICAREQEGYDALKKTYGLSNVIRTNDLVLNNKEINVENIFRDVPIFEVPDINKKSVGIIPNARAMEVGQRDILDELYAEVIRVLLDKGYSVYLLSHSTMDREICKDIKLKYQEENSVILLDQEFSCLEFDEIVKQFDFTIASRFHSIVHAYKNGIPCVSLGWAVKYYDLLVQFKQEQYCFDVREEINKTLFFDKIEQMDMNHMQEATRIINSLKEIQSENIFDILKI